MMQDAKCFVWSNASSSDYAEKITILNLDTAKKLEVTAKDVYKRQVQHRLTLYY